MAQMQFSWLCGSCHDVALMMLSYNGSDAVPCLCGICHGVVRILLSCCSVVNVMAQMQLPRHGSDKVVMLCF